MTEIPEELRLFRSELLDAIDRDLGRGRLRSRSVHHLPFRLGIRTLAVVVAASAAVLIGLTLTATSPPSAYAAAKKALAATAAASSGTITGTVTHDGSSYTLDTTQWNGNSIAVTPGDRSAGGPNSALKLIDGAAYVEQPDGTWLHYASETGVGPKVGPMVELAHDNIEGNTAGQILSLATGLTQATQPDGSTLYTGTIPDSSTDKGTNPNDDLILRIITDLSNGSDNAPNSPGGFHSGLDLKMTVGADGFVRQVSLTSKQQGTTTALSSPTTWTVTYGSLGTTAPIAPPATSTPTPPVVWSQPPACTSACGG
jgi:hypothetical protein